MTTYSNNNELHEMLEQAETQETWHEMQHLLQLTQQENEGELHEEFSSSRPQTSIIRTPMVIIRIMLAPSQQPLFQRANQIVGARTNTPRVSRAGTATPIQTQDTQTGTVGRGVVYSQNGKPNQLNLATWGGAHPERGFANWYAQQVKKTPALAQRTRKIQVLVDGKPCKTCVEAFKKKIQPLVPARTSLKMKWINKNPKTTATRVTANRPPVSTHPMATASRPVTGQRTRPIAPNTPVATRPTVGTRPIARPMNPASVAPRPQQPATRPAMAGTRPMSTTSTATRPQQPVARPVTTTSRPMSTASAAPIPQQAVTRPAHTSSNPVTTTSRPMSTASAAPRPQPTVARPATASSNSGTAPSRPMSTASAAPRPQPTATRPAMASPSTGSLSRENPINELMEAELTVPVSYTRSSPKYQVGSYNQIAIKVPGGERHHIHQSAAFNRANHQNGVCIELPQAIHQIANRVQGLFNKAGRKEAVNDSVHNVSIRTQVNGILVRYKTNTGIILPYPTNRALREQFENAKALYGLLAIGISPSEATRLLNISKAQLIAAKAKNTRVPSREFEQNY